MVNPLSMNGMSRTSSLTPLQKAGFTHGSIAPSGGNPSASGLSMNALPSSGLSSMGATPDMGGMSSQIGMMFMMMMMTMMMFMMALGQKGGGGLSNLLSGIGGSKQSPDTGGSSSSSSPATGSGNSGGGSLGQSIDQAVSILAAQGVPVDKMNKADIRTIIEHESGGNAHAVNGWDSNAAKGTPSKGLMQTIDPTFNSYKLAGHNDIFNPVDNIIAGVRYAISRYGSVSNVPGVKAVRNGGKYVGY